MTLDTIFTLEVVLVVVLLAAAAGGAIYLAVSNRRVRRETGREVSTANIPVDMALEEYAEDTTIERATPREPRREFYKSMGLETTEDMKICLYSLEEYRDELGGTHAATDSGFVAATKAYRQLDDEWYDYSPRKAADVLELAPKDYEVDGDRSALLLRRLPPGLPPEARNALWGRTVNHFRQQQMWEGRQAFVDEEGTRARLWETAQKFLQAATVEAFGRPGTYVTRDQVMQRANMVDTEHFITIARYLEERGWIAEADFDYGVFVVTGSSITEATR